MRPVFYVQRFTQTDPFEVCARIADLCTRYGARIVACDFGVGQDRNLILGQQYDLPIAAVQYVTGARLMDWKDDGVFGRYQVDRTTALDALFHQLKSGRIAFPRFEDFEPFASDFLAVTEELVEGRYGRGLKIYRHPANEPDDVVHAVNYLNLALHQLVGGSAIELPGATYDEVDQ